MTLPKTFLLKKHFSITAIILLSFSNAFSQSNQKSFARNTFYVEAASKAADYSINYDHIFHSGDKFSWSYRVGFFIGNESIALPIGINLITGKKSHHAEFGVTLEPFVDHDKTFLSGSSANESDKYLYVIPAAGYRYQPEKGGFFFKVTASPTIFLDPASDHFWRMDPKLIFYASAGAGFSF